MPKKTDWEAEYAKCKASPYYFYTNYITFDGEKATTHLTEEEFNQYIKDLNHARRKRPTRSA